MATAAAYATLKGYNWELLERNGKLQKELEAALKVKHACEMNKDLYKLWKHLDCSGTIDGVDPEEAYIMFLLMMMFPKNVVRPLQPTMSLNMYNVRLALKPVVIHKVAAAVKSSFMGASPPVPPDKFAEYLLELEERDIGSATPQEGELPPGWTEELDQNRNPYYEHKSKGLMTTKHPKDTMLNAFIDNALASHPARRSRLATVVRQPTQQTPAEAKEEDPAEAKEEDPAEFLRQRRSSSLPVSPPPDPATAPPSAREPAPAPAPAPAPDAAKRSVDYLKKRKQGRSLVDIEGMRTELQVKYPHEVKEISDQLGLTEAEFIKRSGAGAIATAASSVGGGSTEQRKNTLRRKSKRRRSIRRKSKRRKSKRRKSKLKKSKRHKSNF
jgi:hypothetical protein